MPTITFSKWSGPDGLEQYIINETGCKPFSGAGINYRSEQKTTLLRSVDDTYYYNDDMDDVDTIKYTLFGHNGDQDENEKRYNEPLLNPNKTRHIYAYRVKKGSKKDKYIWYGKYKIVGKETQIHIGEDHKKRKIILLTLHKV